MGMKTWVKRLRYMFFVYCHYRAGRIQYRSDPPDCPDKHS
jgi:hypothetical protein